LEDQVVKTQHVWSVAVDVLNVAAKEVDVTLEVCNVDIDFMRSDN